MDESPCVALNRVVVPCLLGKPAGRVGERCGGAGAVAVNGVMVGHDTDELCV